MRALDAPPLSSVEPNVTLKEALQKKPVTETLTHPRRKIELSRLADADAREGRSQTAR
jgi:hypothetical protein